MYSMISFSIAACRSLRAPSCSNRSKKGFSSSSARLLSEITLFTDIGASFLLASSGEAAGFLLITERMRLFLSPHTQLSVIPLPAGHPMGLDTERIDLIRYETILSQLSNQETQWIQANAEHKLQLATALWTAKEALAKVLCTGLMSPVQIYNLSEFNRISSGNWEGLFENFAQ